MPFSLGVAYDDTMGWLLRGGTPRAIAHSPIYTAMVIVTIVTFIAWMVFPELGGLSEVIRFWIISAVGTTLMMCAHNHILAVEYEEKSRAPSVAQIMNRDPRIKGISGVPDVPVTPFAGAGEDSSEELEEDPEEGPEEEQSASKNWEKYIE